MPTTTSAVKAKYEAKIRAAKQGIDLAEHAELTKRYGLDSAIVYRTLTSAGLQPFHGGAENSTRAYRLWDVKRASEILDADAVDRAAKKLADLKAAELVKPAVGKPAAPAPALDINELAQAVANILMPQITETIAKSIFPTLDLLLSSLGDVDTNARNIVTLLSPKPAPVIKPLPDAAAEQTVATKRSNLRLGVIGVHTRHADEIEKEYGDQFAELTLIPADAVQRNAGKLGGLTDLIVLTSVYNDGRKIAHQHALQLHPVAGAHSSLKSKLSELSGRMSS